MKKLLLILTLTIFSYSLYAQDIHFTSYQFSPLTLNPALAGAFSGTYRIGGVYRDQWRSVAGNGGFKTPTIHVDAPIVRGVRKQDWVGIGIGVFSSRSNSYNLVENRSFQGISYHLALDKKQTQIIALGIQNGVGQRAVKLNGKTLKTESLILSDFTSGNPTSDNKLINSSSKTLTDWVGGLTYSNYLGESFVRAGLSVGRIGGANRSISTQGQDKHGIKYTLFGMYDFPIYTNLFLTPSLLYQQIGNNRELVLQTSSSYLLNPQKAIFLNAGIGYRLGDALQLMVGMDYKDIKVQFAYDANLSKLRGASRSIGSFELGVMYIGKVYKKPKIKPTEVCPRI